MGCLYMEDLNEVFILLYKILNFRLNLSYLSEIRKYKIIEVDMGKKVLI